LLTDKQTDKQTNNDDQTYISSLAEVMNGDRFSMYRPVPAAAVSGQSRCRGRGEPVRQ